MWSLCALLVLSCGLEGGGPTDTNGDGGDGRGADNNPPGTSKKFWALNANDRLFQLDAVVRAEGQYCKFWVQQSLQLDESVLSELVFEYDNKIRPAVLDAFSVQGPIYEPETGKVVAQNSLEWADYLGDGDGKLSILILDIPGGSKTSYVAGYFVPHNFYAKSDPRKDYYQTSNETDLIYMNSRLLSDMSEFGATLAHETQHLINFVNSALLRRYYDKDWDMWDWESMDLWINEGLSSAAEHVYSGKYSEERISWYNNQDEVGGKIPSGNNFFVWGERPDNILDEYSTVYLFFQWLRLQSGGSHEIYQRISSATVSDHQAVVSALQGKGNYVNDTHLTWETLLGDWLAANVLAAKNAPSPKHGYMKEPLLSELKVWTVPSGYNRVRPYPGEGIVSFTNAADKTYGNISGHGENMRYAAVNYSGDGSVNNEKSYAKGLLITYNVNTVNEAEPGKTFEDLRELGEISPDEMPLTFSLAKKSLKSFAPHASLPPLKPQAISMEDFIRLRKYQALEAAASENIYMKH